MSIDRTTLNVSGETIEGAKANAINMITSLKSIMFNFDIMWNGEKIGSGPKGDYGDDIDLSKIVWVGEAEAEEVEEVEEADPVKELNLTLKEEIELKMKLGKKFIILTGPTGAGKTSVILELMAEKGLTLGVLLGNAQVSESSLLGYKNLLRDDEYAITLLKKAVTEGYPFLIEEIDAIPSSILTILTSITNGFMSFPDRVVRIHDDFILFGTSNTINQSDITGYTGRQRVDSAIVSKSETIHVSYDRLKTPLYHKLEELHNHMKNSSDSVVMSAREPERVIEMYEEFSKIEGIDPLYEAIKYSIFRRYDVDFEKEFNRGYISNLFGDVDLNVELYKSKMPKLLTIDN